MHTLTRTLALSLTSLVLAAAPAAAETELEKKRDAKLQEAWFTSNEWTHDYDEAKKRAKESGKVIFGYFTRSYSF